MNWNDIKDVIDEIKNESCGGGYVSNTDMKKDPKHISGERWRIKFQSDSDLKKHGNTEKSPVSKKVETINPSEIREVIRELLKEMWIGFEEEKVKKVNEIEHPDKKYIIWGRSGPIVKYYVVSPSQGGRMVANARSMAKMFDTEEQTRNQILKLRQNYLGIKNWSFDTVHKDYRDGPTPKHIISPPVKRGDEWIVLWITDGKRNEDRTYYTDDRQDALDTFIHMLRNADADNKAGR